MKAGKYDGALRVEIIGLTGRKYADNLKQAKRVAIRWIGCVDPERFKLYRQITGMKDVTVYDNRTDEVLLDVPSYTLGGWPA